MLVLVTGAGGTLGRALRPALAGAGHSIRTFDTRDGDVVGDIRDADAVARAVAGVDAIVHAAALHAVHLDLRSPREFWDTNVTGTFNVYEAARRQGVSRVVFCSTMGVYGRRLHEATVIDDETPVAPSDLYATTKALGEQLAAAYARSAGIATVALRLGMFVPETWERYGFRLLFGGVDERDAADAVTRALAYTPVGGFETMNVFAEVPFDDPVELARDPEGVLERHWPGLTLLGLDARAFPPGTAIWRSDRARAALGWRAHHTFGQFLDAHRRSERAASPADGLCDTRL